MSYPKGFPNQCVGVSPANVAGGITEKENTVRESIETPTVPAEPDGQGGCTVDCPWCPGTHMHGEGMGHRSAHCRPIMKRGRVMWEPPAGFPNPGYILAPVEAAVDWEREYVNAEVALGDWLMEQERRKPFCLPELPKLRKPVEKPRRKTRAELRREEAAAVARAYLAEGSK